MKNHFQSHRRITGPSKTQKQFVTDSIFQFHNRKNPVLFVVVNWIWCQRSPFIVIIGIIQRRQSHSSRSHSPIRRPSIFNAKGVIHAIDMHQSTAFSRRKKNKFISKELYLPNGTFFVKRNFCLTEIFLWMIGNNWWGKRWGPPTDAKRRRCWWYFQVDSKLNYRRLKGIRLEKKMRVKWLRVGTAGAHSHGEPCVQLLWSGF